MSTEVDEVQLDHWADPPNKNNLYHDIPMHPTLVVPSIPIHMTDIDNDDNATDDKTIDAEAAKMEEAVLGSTTIDRRRSSTRNRTPHASLRSVSTTNPTQTAITRKVPFTLLWTWDMTLTIPPPSILTHSCMSWALQCSTTPIPMPKL
jgi:hypothetical protein